MYHVYYGACSLCDLFSCIIGNSGIGYFRASWLLRGSVVTGTVHRKDNSHKVIVLWRELMYNARDQILIIPLCDGCRVDVVKHKMDHLSCFIPAMLALGAHANAVTGAKATRYLQVAEELTHTCWQMYHQMASGKRPSPTLCLLLSKGIHRRRCD